METILIPGTDYLVLAEDSAASAESLRRGSLCTDRPVSDLILSHCARGSVVLDVGAFLGYVSRPLLDAGLEVLAFESQQDAFTCLKNNCPEAQAFRCAVGDGSSVIVSRGCSGGASINLGTRRVIPVGSPCENSEQSFPIDRLELTKVDFVKLDVEGTEPLVLKGMQTTLARHKPFVLFEVIYELLGLNGWTVFDCVKWLPGYRFELAIGAPSDRRIDVLATPILR